MSSLDNAEFLLLLVGWWYALVSFKVQRTRESRLEGSILVVVLQRPERLGQWPSSLQCRAEWIDALEEERLLE